MMKACRRMLAAGVILGFGASVERVGAASSCSPPEASPCGIMHSLFGNGAWPAVGPPMNLRQSTPAIDPSAAGTARRRLPAKTARPVPRVSSQAPVASIIVPPAPVAVSESITAADRVAAVFRPPDPPPAASGLEPWSRLLGWVLGAAGLASLLLAKTADV